jgi:hypothetical protein
MMEHLAPILEQLLAKGGSKAAFWGAVMAWAAAATAFQLSVLDVVRW